MKFGLLAAAVALAGVLRGDDVVGVTRVAVPSNDVAVAVLPYAPLVDGFLDVFLSGPFVGDGGAQSDVLRLYSADGAATNAFVWGGSGWLDAAAGTNAAPVASPGDFVALLPSGSMPFGFFLFGRIGSAVSGGGAPSFTGMSVDPEGAFADLGISPGGGTTDILVRDADDLGAEPAVWSHAGRFAATDGPFVWRDASLAASATNRLYMVSDALRDADRDGIPDAVERCVYGTSPVRADTDGDGIRDGLEVAWGTDPLLADFGTGWLFFEPFELPDVAVGELDGQRGWRVDRPSAAVVQTKTVRSGRAALRLSAADGEDGYGSAYVERSVTNADDVVWVDAYCVAVPAGASAAMGMASDGVGMFFSHDAHPVASDGGVLRTNREVLVALGEWTRITFRLDYPARRWDLYVDGVVAHEGLRMGAAAASFSAIGGRGDGEMFMDDLAVSGTRPLGLSSDGDPLPDEWEFRHFGSLGRDGTGDADGDGLPDLEEFRRRTDPLAADTDGDGLSDAVEVNFYGTSPLAADTDGDGVSDAREIACGADPLVPAGDGGEFVESFELPDVAPGELDGQNGWAVAGSGSAVVQASVARTGAAALKVSAADADGRVFLSRPVTGEWRTVWLDVYSVAWESPSPACMDGIGFFFDRAGHPVVCSDGTFTTNVRVRVNLGGWARTTMRIDYASRTWDAYVAGVAVGMRLPLPPSSGEAFGGIECCGDGETVFDDIRISDTRPQGLSSDGDVLPDDWELAHFGNLDRTGFGDADRDGLRDVDELKAGTDPNSADTDGDGIPDRWEVRCGTDPNDPSDAAADPDGDGIDNTAEHLLGLDPLRPDADPRIPPAIALRAGRPWYLTGQTVCVSARASDEDGVVKELAVSCGGQVLAHAFGDRASAQYVAAEAGTNTVEAVAVDDTGKSAAETIEIPVLDADADDDGDGLANADEQTWGTDPRLADTDGDGIPDAAEVRIGTNPVVADADADPDGDGLRNIEEFLHGTDIRLADTDGDGVSDVEECTVLFSDPLAVDFDGTVVTNAVIPASAVDAAKGTWYVVGDVLAIGERAGSAFFTNDLFMSECGMRQLRMDVWYAGTFDAELVCRIDGRMVGTALLHAAADVHVEHVRFTSFWMAEGTHTVEFELQNFGNGATFSMGSVAVCKPQGSDDDANGVPDWLDSRISASRVIRGAEMQSFVSPFCLRGRASRPDMVALSEGQSVSPLPGFGWCADVALDPTNATQVGVTYENGMKNEAVAIQWVPFDALNATDVALRRGDSLLFAADGTTVVLDGNEVSDGLGGPTVHCFSEAGDFRLVACSGARTNVVAVHVAAVEVPGAMPVWRGKVNSVPFSSPQPGRLSVLSDRGGAVVSVEGSGASCVCGLSVDALGRPSCLAFEIPNRDASVVRSLALQPFAAHYTTEGRYHVVDVSADGSRIVENRLSAFGLPPSAVLRMTSGSGISFVGGSGFLELTGADFDEIGDFSYQFLVPPGVAHPCQFLRLMFNGKVVAR